VLAPAPPITRSTPAGKGRAFSLAELQEAQDDVEDLHRQLQAEQLRVSMLHTAVEAERQELGDSLGSAEARLAGLDELQNESALLDHRESLLEQQLTVECRDILACHRLDEATAQAHIAALKCELSASSSEILELGDALADAERSVGNTISTQLAAAPNVEGLFRSTSASLSAARRREHDAAAAYERHAMEASSLSQAIKDLESRLADMPELVRRASLAVAASRCDAAHAERQAFARARLAVHERSLKAQEDAVSAAKAKVNAQKDLCAVAEARIQHLNEELSVVAMELRGDASKSTDSGSGWLSWLVGDGATQAANTSVSTSPDAEVANLQKQLAEAFARQMQLDSDEQRSEVARNARGSPCREANDAREEARLREQLALLEAKLSAQKSSAMQSSAQRGYQRKPAVKAPSIRLL